MIEKDIEIISTSLVKAQMIIQEDEEAICTIYAMGDKCIDCKYYSQCMAIDNALKEVCKIELTNNSYKEKSIMTFKEFSRWCNNKACTGQLGYYEATTCMSIYEDVKKVFILKREKYWQEKYAQDVYLSIVEPTEKIIKQYEQGDFNDSKL